MLLEKMIVPRSEQRINYAQHEITADDKKAVMDALDSDWVAGNGPLSRKYAEALSEYTGYKYVVPVCNGTAALFVAYLALDSEIWPYQYETKVTVPNLTFVATANTALEAMLSLGVVDVDPLSLVVDGNTVGVSFAGYPSRDHFLCDDAHGIAPNMIKQGNLISTISTHAIKQLTTGEGGAVLTNNADIYEYVSEFVDQGRGPSRTSFGYGMNYRLPELNCALGLSQLKRAGDMFIYRQMLAKTYYNLLKDIPEIRLPANHADHAWHLFVVRFQSNEIRNFVKEGLLIDSNIAAQIHYPPLTSYSHIGGNREDYPNTYDAWETGLSIPMHNSLSFADVELVAEAIKVQLKKWQKR